MKFTPCSRARSTIRAAAAGSAAPPNIIVPRHSGETFNPLRPNSRYCILPLPGFRPPTLHPIRTAVASPPGRNQPRGRFVCLSDNNSKPYRFPAHAGQEHAFSPGYRDYHLQPQGNGRHDDRTGAGAGRNARAALAVAADGSSEGAGGWRHLHGQGRNTNRAPLVLSQPPGRETVIRPANDTRLNEPEGDARDDGSAPPGSCERRRRLDAAPYRAGQRNG